MCISRSTSKDKAYAYAQVDLYLALIMSLTFHKNARNDFSSQFEFVFSSLSNTSKTENLRSTLLITMFYKWLELLACNAFRMYDFIDFKSIASVDVV